MLPKLLIEEVHLWGKGTYTTPGGHIYKRPGGRVSYTGTALTRLGNTIRVADYFGGEYTFFIDSGKAVDAKCPYDFMEFIEG